MSRQPSIGAQAGTRSPPVAESDEVNEAIRRHAAKIHHEELRTAVNRLRSQGHLSDAQERILEDMATTILHDLLRAPEAMLEDAEELDRATQRAIIELFDPNK